MPAATPPPARTPLRRDALALAGVFALALGLRVAYVLQLSAAPFFDRPLGDSAIYLARAREILAGDLLGREVFFHSSPPYPYLLAAVLGLPGGSLLAVYLVQAVIGAASCVLVALLARRLAPGSRLAAPLAGALAALYGLLAFFDGDLLMIFLCLFFAEAALLLLLAARERGSAGLAAGAGVALGLAALDKVNLLLFAPLALLFLATGLARAPARRAWRPALAFGAALALTVLPVTVRNLVVGQDLVLVSSNGGVNLYIGNHPGAPGYFRLPPGSGLRDPPLHESSLEAAARALGRPVKPSEASAYWASRALDYLRSDPGGALALLGRKAYLLVNAYELPNHMNFYYVRAEHAPVLALMPVGFWLALPLGAAGLALLLGRGASPAARLLAAFLVCYVASLLPFFVSERYRLPLVPVLLAFGAAGVAEAARALRERRGRRLLAWAGGLAVAGVLVALPSQPFAYTLDRAVGAQRLLEAALDDPARAPALLDRAIVGYRWTLEVEPRLGLARFQLARALAASGRLEAAAAELRAAAVREPRARQVRTELARIEAMLAERAATAEPPVPATPYEEALALERAGRIGEARQAYRALLARDPFHGPARARLAALPPAG